MDRAHRVLRETFGFEEFRPGQADVISSVLEGRDTVAVMPTGSGKSLCFQLPALLLDGLTLVVSPLIALMKDQLDVLSRLGIPALTINSSMSLDDQHRALAEIARGRHRLLYVAPERFRSERFLAALQTVRTSLLVVDEAHCISQWGHDFRPDYMRVGRVRQALSTPRVLALTATATPEVREDILRQLGLGREARCFVAGFARPNLRLEVRQVSSQREKMAAIREVARLAGGAGIIYAATRANVERLVEDLKGSLKPLAYHGGLDAAERTRNQDAFMRGQAGTIVATNAFGMGVDRADIRYVVHFDVPGSMEAYYQEAGRAGRDGKPATCCLLFNYADTRHQEFFIESEYPPRDLVMAVHRALLETPEPIRLTNQDLIACVPMRASERQVSAALKRLESAGSIRRGRQHAPARVELGNEETPSGQAPVQLAVLDALKRRARGGVVVFDERWLADKEGIGEEALQRALRALHGRGAIRFEPSQRSREITLPQRSNAPDIDWEALERRETLEREKLRGMVRYGYSNGCRQREILAYFGECADRCGHCDRCSAGVGQASSLPNRREPQAKPRDRHAPPASAPRSGATEIARGVSPGAGQAKGLPEQAMSLPNPGQAGKAGQKPAGPLTAAARPEEFATIRKLLSIVARVGGKVDTEELVHQIRGGSDGGISRFAVIPKPPAFLRSLLGGLQARGLIGGNGKPELTPLGWDMLAGRDLPDVPYPEAADQAGQASSLPRLPGSGAGMPPSDGGEERLSGDDLRLFESLRAWRKEVSAGRGVPAFQVFHDRTLRDLARHKPRSRDDLLGIHGIGQAKLARHGAAVLGLIGTWIDASGEVPRLEERFEGAASAVYTSIGEKEGGPSP